MGPLPFRGAKVASSQVPLFYAHKIILRALRMNAQKEITLETGAIIMAPLFINIGEKIRVNTTDRSYGERVK